MPPKQILAARDCCRIGTTTAQAYGFSAARSVGSEMTLLIYNSN
jgi:hypothetical protein